MMTDSDKELCRDMIDRGYTSIEIATELDMSECAVRAWAGRQGLSFRRRDPKTAYERILRKVEPMSTGEAVTFLLDCVRVLLPEDNPTMRLHNTTTTEATIYAYLLENQGRTVTKQQIHDRLYFDRPDPPDIKIVDIYICKLRKKVPTGAIRTIWGEGYMLETTDAEADQ